MSYDLYAFHPSLAANLEAVADLLDSETYVNESKPAVDSNSDKWKIVRALTSKHPHLHPFDVDYPELAASLDSTVEYAQETHRSVELNGPDDGPGIQLRVYDQAAEITLPYWHEGAKGNEVLSEVWGYLQDLSAQGLCTLYDPQLDKLLSLDDDFEGAIGVYGDTVDKFQGLMDKRASHEKPWWRFW